MSHCSVLPPKPTQEEAICSLRAEAVAVAQEIDREYADGAGTEEKRLYDDLLAINRWVCEDLGIDPAAHLSALTGAR